MVVPVIDFSKLDDGAERAATMAQIANGCEEWGFFQLVNHGIPMELLERVKEVCSECYRLREAGFKASEPVRTLDALVEAERRGEAVTPVDDMDWEDIFFIHDGNQWPSDPPAFTETMREYRAELKKLAERVMEVMDENLGLERGAIKSAFTGGSHDAPPFFGTKVSHYPPCPRPDLVTGLRAHTDAGGVILLFQDDRVGGLEVLKKDGEWTDVQPLAGAIVVNTGDQIEVLSNGRYRSAWHRILPMRDGNRRSVASFYNPSDAATISPAVVGGEGLEYPKYVFGDYMEVYAKQKFQAKEPRFEAVKAPKSSPAADEVGNGDADDGHLPALGAVPGQRRRRPGPDSHEPLVAPPRERRCGRHLLPGRGVPARAERVRGLRECRARGVVGLGARCHRRPAPGPAGRRRADLAVADVVPGVVAEVDADERGRPRQSPRVRRLRRAVVRRELRHAERHVHAPVPRRRGPARALDRRRRRLRRRAY